MSILPRLLPREEEFFTSFIEIARCGREASDYLLELFDGPAQRRAYCVEQIKRLENEADDATHGIVNRLDRTFITPIDREDIHLLASHLDDVIDRIDGIARRAMIFRLGPTPDGIVPLCKLVCRITVEIEAALEKLQGKNDVMQHCMAAKQLENEADALYQQTLGAFFDREKDPITLIKWKEIFDNLEGAMDQGEDVANDIESVVLKHA